MNDDWDDMNEDARRLDETGMMLDASNFNRRNQHASNALAPPVMQNQGKPLQESVLMSFGDEGQANGANFRPQLVDAGAGLQQLSKLASVDITDFDWRYEK